MLRKIKLLFVKVRQKLKIPLLKRRQKLLLLFKRKRKRQLRYNMKVRRRILKKSQKNLKLNKPSTSLKRCISLLKRLRLKIRYLTSKKKLQKNRHPKMSLKKARRKFKLKQAHLSSLPKS